MKTRVTRQQRALRGTEVAGLHDGVAHRTELRAAGLTRHDVSSEVAAGRWLRAGRHTVVIGTGPPRGEALLWRAVWESGSGAVLDGVAALVASGLTGLRSDVVDVALPARSRGHLLPGVRLRRRRDIGPCLSVGVPRVRPEVATVHAAQWARSDRQAALIICLVVQQRLVPPARLLDHWLTVTRSPRRGLLHSIIRDVCDGAQSLGELDFARLCRGRGLPEPSRQVVRLQRDGRVYLDVAWEDIGLVVEIDGGHHGLALNPVDDALRQNEVVLGASRVLRVPVIGLRLDAVAFLDQVVRAHRLLRDQPA